MYTGAMKPLLRSFNRNARGGEYLELFLVAAAATVIGVRLFLAATGYPQVGGKELHVAHVLWGGLLMASAMIITLTFIGRAPLKLAAVLGGAGFGLFVDEIGKFLTKTNNYFFKPALPLIYLSFILLFLVVRLARRPLKLSPTEQAVNDAVNGRATAPGPPSRASRWLERAYRLTIANKWVLAVINVILILEALLVLAAAGLIIFAVTTHRPVDLDLSAAYGNPVLTWIVVGASLASGGLIIAGALQIYVRRLRAYRLILAGTLINIFFVQIFDFYEDQLGALAGLAFNIFVFLVIRYGIERETAKAKPPSSLVK